VYLTQVSRGVAQCAGLGVRRFSQPSTAAASSGLKGINFGKSTTLEAHCYVPNIINKLKSSLTSRHIDRFSSCYTTHI